MSGLDLSVKSANGGNRELKRLVCLGYYDIKGGHSNRVTRTNNLVFCV